MTHTFGSLGDRYPSVGGELAPLRAAYRLTAAKFLTHHKARDRGQGLIASKRASSGHRRYPRAVLRRLAFIVFAQRIGLALDEIGTELEKLPPDHAPNPQRPVAPFGHLAVEDRREDSGARASHGLTECIGCGCLSLDRCALANPGDRAGRLDAGPRYWIGAQPKAGDFDEGLPRPTVGVDNVGYPGQIGRSTCA